MSETQANSLLQQLNQQVSTFNTDSSEANRLAIIQRARDLIGKYQTPQESTFDLSYSPTHFLCVFIAIDLGIFRTLASSNGPVTLQDLAAVKGADPVLVERVLRILSAIRYVNEDEAKLFSANKMTREMSTRLAEGRIKFIWFGMPTLARIPEYLRRTGFKNPEGATDTPLNLAENTPKTMWEWYSSDPERFDACNTFMEGDRGSRPSWLDWVPVKERVVDGFDPSLNAPLLVDVAGGRGHDLDAFRRRFPDVGRLVLEDQPHVLGDVGDLDQSIERVGMDLFAEQPVKNARAYFTKLIFHDWNDTDSRKILGNLAAAMKKGYSKLIIAEFVLPDKDCPLLPAQWDWEMMVFCNSMERSRAHWQQLLESAGFKVLNFYYPPGDGQAIIETELA